MNIEWDYEKALLNAKKHGITFEEAVTCFYDPLQVAFYDIEHSDDEIREIMIAHSENGQVLLVSYAVRNEIVRIISARLETKRERKAYEEGI